VTCRLKLFVCRFFGCIIYTLKALVGTRTLFCCLKLLVEDLGSLRFPQRAKDSSAISHYVDDLALSENLLIVSYLLHEYPLSTDIPGSTISSYIRL